MAQQDKKAKLKSMKLTPERTMEVADSLQETGERKVRVGFIMKKEKQKNFQDLIDRGSKDLINSYRYENLALKAMNKNK
jgi:hypothetical protein